jgi:molecular chaperone DnaK
MVANRYRVLELLGQGGMGQVWRGEDVRLERAVAVKVLLPHLLHDQIREQALSRFAREGRAAARLSHRNIAAVHDVGEHDGRPYLVLEYLRGRDLRSLLRESPDGLPVQDALSLCAQVADGLAAAHEAEIVHRDIKPANLMLGDDGTVRICDFGIARLHGATTGLTGGATIGTLAYMAPEQLLGQDVDHRADLYALGATLFHLLTGRHVFVGDDARAVIAQHLAAPPPSARTLRPDIPPQVEEYLRAFLAKEPGQRPGDTTAVAGRLRELSRSHAEGGQEERTSTPGGGGDSSTGSGRGRAVGIDLGTTNSAIAVMEGGQPTVIANAEGTRTTPSVVAFAEDGRVLVGEAARRQAAVNVDRTVGSVKREMGTGWKAGAHGRSFIPQQISAFVLQKLKRDAEAYLGEEVADAVIAVPAYFSDRQRQATREAGRIAGLNVLRILNEPTLAAMAYHLEKEDEATIVLFDLGGGSCSVAVVEVGDGVVEVKATSGDNHLGGDDWDGRVVDWLVERFGNAGGVDLSEDRPALRRLREAAEQAKIELSSSSETRISIPYITSSGEGPPHLDETLTRAAFQTMTADLLDRCKVPFQRVLEDSGIGVDEIDHVVLVGGATRMPAVADMVRELTGGRGPSGVVDPLETVAVGAVLQAGVLKGEVKDVLPMDVVPVSLGIEVRDGALPATAPENGHFYKIIERNTSFPTKRSEILSTADDGQRSVEIRVYEGEREIAAYNNRLATFQLTGLPPAPRGVPQIQVAFDIDANGIVCVSAEDLGTGRRRSMVVTGGSALPEHDIERMMREAERYAAEERRRREEAEVRSQADILVHSTEKYLRENGGNVSGNLKKQVEEAVAEVRKHLEGTDIGMIRATAEKLNRINLSMRAINADSWQPK